MLNAPPPTDEEQALERQLARATTDTERGRLHAALAICAGRALAYRRMNFHEAASAQAYAQTSKPLRDACLNHDAAMAAFHRRDEAEGIALLCLARPVIVAELGERHPYAHQVSNTLAGHLSGEHTLGKRLALRQWLVTCFTGLYGASHTRTCQAIADEAYLLAATGAVQAAIVAFEQAIDGLLQGPWPDQTGSLLMRLAALCHKVGEAQRTAPLERRMREQAPNTAWHVREVFFHRQPAAARYFNAQALLHNAAHFPGLSSTAEAEVNTPAGGGAPGTPPPDDDSPEAAFAIAIHAFGAHPQGRTFDDSPTLPASWVLSAMERLDALRQPVQAPTAGCPCDDDVEGPFESAERARQSALFDKLLRDDGLSS